MSDQREPDISILVVAYNMARELPRTLSTLSPAYQRGVDDLQVEICVLDNGSTPAVDSQALQSVLPGISVIRPERISVSPAAAINAAMPQLKGKLLGLWIDGARLASPGILRLAHEAWRADPRRAIGTLAFHLGPDVQMRSVFEGYDAAAEDALLDRVPWREDGYRLFDISVLAGSSAAGWFGCINETNGLFMDRSLWDRIGGLDERFQSPGGGFVNLDLWERAVAASDHEPWMMLGEGTFHQVHGGAATNAPADDRTAMRNEYAELHGRKFKGPVYRPHFVGTLDAHRYEAGQPRPLDRLRQAHSVRGRPFRVDLPTRNLSAVQRGTLRTRYKGLRLAKSPFDLALYMQALARLRPRTIIEIGTSEGGSALWLLDQCRNIGLADTSLITIDIDPPELRQPPEGITIHKADSTRPEETFPTPMIEAAPHPWLVIEDSAHSFESASATLDYFDRRLKKGDMLVLEDGVLADLEGDVYRDLKDGPNRALKRLLDAAGDRYAIDTNLCDFYGHNVTYAPNAWLRRL